MTLEYSQHSRARIANFELGDRVGGHKKKIEDYFSNHPELRDAHTLDLPPEAVSLLVPDAVKAGQFELRIGPDKTSRSLHFAVVDKRVRYDRTSARTKLHFEESRDVTDLFLDEEQKMPVLYVQLGKLNKDQKALVLETIDINADYHGKGLGSECKERLIALAQMLGFDYIVAEAFSQGSFDFFVKEEGGNNFTELKDARIKQMMKEQGIWDPKDKRKLVIKRLD
ncbi:MAG: hypothetical protein WCW16_05050 [Candidatus Magasanikbacteria bacterium]